MLPLASAPHKLEVGQLEVGLGHLCAGLGAGIARLEVGLGEFLDAVRDGVHDREGRDHSERGEEPLLEVVHDADLAALADAALALQPPRDAVLQLAELGLDLDLDLLDVSAQRRVLGLQLLHARPQRRVAALLGGSRLLPVRPLLRNDGGRHVHTQVYSTLYTIYFGTKQLKNVQLDEVCVVSKAALPYACSPTGSSSAASFSGASSPSISSSRTSALKPSLSGDSRPHSRKQRRR